MAQRMKKPTHVYIGRDKGGCCLAVRSDYGDKETGKSVGEMIASGLTVERVDWDTYRAVSEEPTFMNCCCEPDPKALAEIAGQPVLF